MREKRGKLILIFIFIVLISVLNVDAFDVNNVFLKVSLEKGKSIEKKVGISSDVGGSFDIYVKGIDGVRVSDEILILQDNENKEFTVYFDSLEIDEGVHVGNILISGEGESKIIPLVFEVESKDLFFDANLVIPQQYIEIPPGGKFVADLTIFDLISGGTSEGIGPTTVDIDYLIFDLDGNSLVSESESIVIDKQTRVSKVFTLPENAEEGQYVFSGIVRYRSSVGVSSQLFNIAEIEVIGINRLNIENGFVWVIFLTGGLFIVILIIFVFLIRDRDKIIGNLRRFHSEELRRQREFLARQERVMIKRGAGKKGVRKEVKRKIIALKKRQRKHIHEIKKLRNSGNLRNMKRKLTEWKKEGYNTLPLEFKLKGLNNSEKKKMLGAWKKHYKK